ncbi:MAG: hypothetical protein KY391_06900 [Actinobacteria bacterium]|nr:hypothetical protein [Actinomycetota bacterium]
MTAPLYENDVAGFRAAVPDAWIVIEDHLGAAAVFLEPARGPNHFRSSITVVAQEAGKDVDLEAFIDRELAQMGRFLTDFHIVERKAAGDVRDGAVKIRSIYRQGIFEISLEQVVIPATDRVFTITSTAEASEVTRVRDASDGVYDSFEVSESFSEMGRNSGPS